jgi:hypothetical protein
MGLAAIARRASIGLPVFFVLPTVCARAFAEDERSACATTAEQAQELRAAHRLKEARDKLVDCSRPSCPGIVSQDCSQWLAELNAIAPSLVIRASDSAGLAVTSVRVWIDGVKAVDPPTGEAIAVDPGTHQLHVEADTMLPVDQQITVSEGERNRLITVRLVALRPPTPVVSPQPASRGSRIMTVLPYALASVGVVALGGFTYFGIKGTSEADELAAGCGATKSCSESQVDPVRKHLLIADVSLGVSLLSLGAATWVLAARHPAKPKKPAALQVGAVPGAGSIKLSVAF